MNKQKSKPRGEMQTPKRPRPGARAKGSTGPRQKEKPGPEPFTAEELRRISGEISSYHQAPAQATRLELMEIDPWNLHAYWHIEPDDLAAGRADLGNGNADLVLRFSDISPRDDDISAPQPGFDIAVSEEGNSWYVSLWRDAKRYSAVIGLRAGDGAFLSLARSNEIATPRGGPSPDLDFRQVEARSPSIYQAVPPGAGAPPSELLLRDLFPQRSSFPEEFPLVAATPYPPSPDEPAFPSLAAARPGAADRDLSALESSEAFEPVSVTVDAQAGEEPFDGTGFPMIEATEVDRYRGLARQIEQEVLAGTPPLPTVAIEAVAPADLEFEPRPLPISPLAAALPMMTREAVPTTPPTRVALEAVLGTSVFSTGAGNAAVELSASILIEGRSRPDTPLALFGEPVPRREDGGFTLRLALAHGPELVALLRRLREEQDKG